MATWSKEDGHRNQQDVHAMVSRWPHDGRNGHTKSTRRSNFGKTFGNFLTCQRFCEHSRSCCRTLKTRPVDTRWLRMQSRMTRCTRKIIKSQCWIQTDKSQSRVIRCHIPVSATASTGICDIVLPSTEICKFWSNTGTWFYYYHTSCPGSDFGFECALLNSWIYSSQYDILSDALSNGVPCE